MDPSFNITYINMSDNRTDFKRYNIFNYKALYNTDYLNSKPRHRSIWFLYKEKDNIDELDFYVALSKYKRSNTKMKNPFAKFESSYSSEIVQIKNQEVSTFYKPTMSINFNAERQDPIDEFTDSKSVKVKALTELGFIYTHKKRLELSKTAKLYTDNTNLPTSTQNLLNGSLSDSMIYSHRNDIINLFYASCDNNEVLLESIDIAIKYARIIGESKPYRIIMLAICKAIIESKKLTKNYCNARLFVSPYYYMITTMLEHVNGSRPLKYQPFRFYDSNYIIPPINKLGRYIDFRYFKYERVRQDKDYIAYLKAIIKWLDDNKLFAPYPNPSEPYWGVMIGYKQAYLAETFLVNSGVKLFLAKTKSSSYAFSIDISSDNRYYNIDINFNGNKYSVIYYFYDSDERDSFLNFENSNPDLLIPMPDTLWFSMPSKLRTKISPLTIYTCLDFTYDVAEKNALQKFIKHILAALGVVVGIITAQPEIIVAAIGAEIVNIGIDANSKELIIVGQIVMLFSAISSVYASSSVLAKTASTLQLIDNSLQIQNIILETKRESLMQKQKRENSKLNKELLELKNKSSKLSHMNDYATTSIIVDTETETKIDRLYAYFYGELGYKYAEYSTDINNLYYELYNTQLIR